jgi:hypothetical protein
LVGDLRRILDTDYLSEFDFHLDLYRSFKRVNDGHCGVYSRCYDCELLDFEDVWTTSLTLVEPSMSPICLYHLSS